MAPVPSSDAGAGLSGCGGGCWSTGGWLDGESGVLVLSGRVGVDVVGAEVVGDGCVGVGCVVVGVGTTGVAVGGGMTSVGAAGAGDFTFCALRSASTRSSVQ